jgi:hypothetical protein
MFKKFLWLEWKAFFRSSSFAGNMVIKILLILAALYFSVCFLALGILAYYGLEDSGMGDPLVVVSKYMIYYVLVDLMMRVMMQKMPIINIKPLLNLPIKRGTVVNFALGKTLVSFFNIIHVFFFVPFTVVLLKEGYGPQALLWLLGMWAIFYCNNMLNVLINDIDNLYIAFLVALAGLAALQYYSFFDITLVTGVFFHGLYATPYLFVLPLLVFAGLWVYSGKYFRKHMYLDTGLKGKHEEATTENLTWLDRFGLMGTFLKNDIKMIKRNKRPRGAVIGGVIFLFYGLLFMTGAIEAYDNPMWKIFAGIFVSGGFLFTFGQFVPSWDSAYYPLMMTQNVKYREYIASKWWLVVVGTAISTVLASFYLYFGIETYLLVVAGAVYNIGLNSYLVLLGGAFIKTPIDLTSGKKAFGDKKAFNVQTMLLTIPKLLVPMALYAIGNAFISPLAGTAFVAGAGVLGIAFRNQAFTAIEKIYKREKYKTLAAYKQTN